MITAVIGARAAAANTAPIPTSPYAPGADGEVRQQVVGDRAVGRAEHRAHEQRRGEHAA